MKSASVKLQIISYHHSHSGAQVMRAKQIADTGLYCHEKKKKNQREACDKPDGEPRIWGLLCPLVICLRVVMQISHLHTVKRSPQTLR